MHRIALRNSARVTALASKAAAPKVCLRAALHPQFLWAFFLTFYGVAERWRLRHCLTLVRNSKAWWVLYEFCG